MKLPVLSEVLNRLENMREKGGHAAGVFFEGVAKTFAQQFFFTADANPGTDEEYCDGRDETDPAAES